MSEPAKTVACLALADGSVFYGSSFGAEGEVSGEVVFNTSMTGYGEILTDPSYCGQIVTMTYPLIGNYGINFEDVESKGPRLKAFVVRELCRTPSNFRSELSLDDYLKRTGVIGLEGIDTRSLVRKLRTQGAVTGVISTVDLDAKSLVAKAQRAPNIVGQDLVREVMPSTPFAWSERLGNFATLAPAGDLVGNSRHVVAIDYGMKWNILRHLTETGCRVSVVPGTATAAEILAMQPDGVFLSNGPGDPEPLTYAVETIRQLLGKVPVFGICLGHQLLGLAAGAKTYKLKFGHRGANQPVLNLRTSRVEITSQNHGFAIDSTTLPNNLEVTHLNLNDQTIEGMRMKDVPAFSVQYHPEAAAGPHDSAYLFEEFCTLMDQKSSVPCAVAAVN
ncbi:MAG: carbamoyl phosphate synthase small subunit [Planctomyces sp.]|nr:carbamoyl phosphate synthase small subunit [Planctomyces sp.]